MQEQKKNAVVIFSGYNQRAVIAFIRTLEAHNVDYYIFARNDNDTILHTTYNKKIFWIRNNPKLISNEIIFNTNKLRNQFNIDNILIAPSTEFLNRFLLKNKKEFLKNNCIIPLVESKLYNNISDKFSFCEICKNFGINTPQQSETIEKFSPPFVAKPFTYLSKSNSILTPKLILDNTDFINFINTEKTDEYFYQEYVDGKSFYLLAYFSFNTNTFFTFSQENLIQQVDGKSIILSVSSDFHFLPEAEKYLSLLKKLAFKGLIMIEIKYWDDKYYMIEANPRFWGPSQLLLDSDNNFFEVFLKEFKLIDKEITLKNDCEKDIYYFWKGGLIEDLKNKKQSKFYNLDWHEILFMQNEIYNKKDTQNIYNLETMNEIEKLKNYYAKTSKHSNYQVLSSKLSLILTDNDLEIKTRYERERLHYFLDNLDFSNKRVLDIGGNTGYFTFELIENDVSSVDYIEGNKEHHNFVKLATEVLNYSNKINLENKYVKFENDTNNWNYDIILLLNVLHHIGDDFGDDLPIDQAKEKIIDYLNKLASKSTYLIFQLGFNWQGNRNKNLFDKGTKSEMIEFIENGIADFWEIKNIGIAEKNNSDVIYSKLNTNNIERVDSLGEFLNRPIFILKSLIKK